MKKIWSETISIRPGAFIFGMWRDIVDLYQVQIMPLGPKNEKEIKVVE